MGRKRKGESSADQKEGKATYPSRRKERNVGRRKVNGHVLRIGQRRMLYNHNLARNKDWKISSEAHGTQSYPTFQHGVCTAMGFVLQ